MSTVSLYRESVWPSLLGKLADESESARLRSEIETEAARLDDGDVYAERLHFGIEDLGEAFDCELRGLVGAHARRAAHAPAY